MEILLLIIIMIQAIIISDLIYKNRKGEDMMAKKEFDKIFDAFEKDMIILWRRIRYNKLKAEEYLKAKHYTPMLTQKKNKIKRNLYIQFYRGKRYKKI